MALGAGKVASVHCGLLPKWGGQRRDGAELKGEKGDGSCRESFGWRKRNLSMYCRLRVYGVYH